MINPSDFYNALISKGISFFTGVPDSLLKDICAYISDNAPKNRHIIAANEGSSIGLAVGNYLASGNPSLVYMQNSGFGNTVNPLLSIADNDEVNPTGVSRVSTTTGALQTDLSLFLLPTFLPTASSL